jgi:hypothetical protein
MADTPKTTPAFAARLGPVYRWRVRTVLGERHGDLVHVLARGALNSCLVEFLADGHRAITSRNYLRRATGTPHELSESDSSLTATDVPELFRQTGP